MKEEKKLNDEDLVKALENCQKDNCDNCPYFINDKACMANNLLADILDLIRRLQYGYSSASKASEEWKVKYEEEREENAELQKQVETWKAKSKELETAWKIASSNEEKAQKQVDELKIKTCPNTDYCGGNIAKAVKDTAKEILQNCGEKHTEIYNRFVFKNSDYGDEEINAIINFSDILYFEIREYFKEKYGVEVE